MKKYIKSADYNSVDNFGYGYGYDSNGDPIDLSTVQELYRIANQEILPLTELGQTGDATIEEDTFEYHFTGTAYGADLKYCIYYSINDDNLDLMSFVKHNAKFYPDFRSNKYSAELSFTIHVNNDDVWKVEFLGADIYENGTYSDYFSDDFREDFDWKRICEIIKEIAEPAVREIHQAMSNI